MRRASRPRNDRPCERSLPRGQRLERLLLPDPSMPPEPQHGQPTPPSERHRLARRREPIGVRFQLRGAAGRRYGCSRRGEAHARHSLPPNPPRGDVILFEGGHRDAPQRIDDLAISFPLTEKIICRPPVGAGFQPTTSFYSLISTAHRAAADFTRLALINFQPHAQIRRLSASDRPRGPAHL